MTEENNIEEELVENVEKELPDNNPQIDEDDTPEIPVISNADQVEPLTVLELYEHALSLLQGSYEDEEEPSSYVDTLYRKHFGDNYTQQDLETDISDERQQAVVTDYIRDRLDYVKTTSSCLNKDKINKSFENIFSLVGLNINISNSVEELYDEIFTRRAGDNLFLLDDYEVLKINRQVNHIYEGKNNITELSGLISQIETLAINIDNDKDNPDFKIVNDEQRAQFYYNVSEIYENEANRKSNMPDINKWHYRAMEYKKKALDLTSENVGLVANVQNEWQYYADYNPSKITDACERIIDNESKNVSERDKYRANKLYADTLLNLQRIDGFAGNTERVNDAIKHYRAALVHTLYNEDKIDILNSISKAQKNNDHNGYIATRLEIADMLVGRPRIREYFKLVDLVENKEFKSAMLKSCINEFHELSSVDNEDRILYDDIDKKLRENTSTDDTQTIKILDKLKKKYGTPPKKDNKLLFPVMSSKGHDYFDK